MSMAPQEEPHSFYLSALLLRSLRPAAVPVAGPAQRPKKQGGNSLCQALTKRGKPCDQLALRGEFCHNHEPNKRSHRVERKQQRQIARGAKRSRKETYAAYLLSPHWKETRAVVLRERGSFCQICGKNQPRGLHVHHNSYRNIGQEQSADLVVLCEECHDIFHKNGRLRQ